MTLHQLEFSAPQWTLSRTLNNLIPSMVIQGEDRSSSGILGAIGFGRQSDLSYRSVKQTNLPVKLYRLPINCLQLKKNYEFLFILFICFECYRLASDVVWRCIFLKFNFNLNFFFFWNHIKKREYNPFLSTQKPRLQNKSDYLDKALLGWKFIEVSP